MFVWIYVCMYVWVYVCTFKYIWMSSARLSHSTRTRGNVYVCMCVCMYICMHVCIFKYTDACMNVALHVMSSARWSRSEKHQKQKMYMYMSRRARTRGDIYVCVYGCMCPDVCQCMCLSVVCGYVSSSHEQVFAWASGCLICVSMCAHRLCLVCLCVFIARTGVRMG